MSHNDSHKKTTQMSIDLAIIICLEGITANETEQGF